MQPLCHEGNSDQPVGTRGEFIQRTGIFLRSAGARAAPGNLGREPGGWRTRAH